MERYNATEFDHLAGEQTASISTGEMSVRNRLEKLAKKHPTECICIAKNTDGSVYYHIPWKWLSIRPPRTVTMSEEERKRKAAILQQYRAKKEK